MARYDTNLASEFYVMACLHRLGMSANLTLGNKKGVDVVVVRDSGDAVTVEVKGLAGKYEWPAANLGSPNPDKHFVVLVGFEGRIDDPKMPSPRVWVIPLGEIEPFVKRYPGGRVNVRRSLVVKASEQYENAWHLIAGVDRTEPEIN